MGNQLPLEKWTKTKLAQAGVDLADRLEALRAMENEESARRKEYKADHERALEGVEDFARRQLLQTPAHNPQRLLRGMPATLGIRRPYRVRDVPRVLVLVRPSQLDRTH